MLLVQLVVAVLKVGSGADWQLQRRVLFVVQVDDSKIAEATLLDQVTAKYGGAGANVMQTSANKSLRRAGLTVDDIDLIIPHQANIRIVEAAWKKLGFSMEKTEMVLEHTGNTSAASIPLALQSALDKGRIQPGTNVLFLGFGAGMTWASAIVRWA